MSKLFHQLSKKVEEFCRQDRSGSYAAKQRRKKEITKVLDEMRESRTMPSSWKTMTIINVARYSQYCLYKKKLSNSSVLNRVYALNKFLIYCKNRVDLSDKSTLGLAMRATYKPMVLAIPLSPDVIEKIEHPVAKVIGWLQYCFGVTPKEAISLSSENIQSQSLHLPRSQTFNSVERSIPVVTHEQVRCLAKLHLIKEIRDIAVTTPKIINLYYCCLQELGLDTKQHHRKAYLHWRYRELIDNKIERSMAVKAISSEMGLSKSQVRRMINVPKIA